MREATETDLRVYQLMSDALDMLDSGGYPADIGAHLDLAICRLRDHVAVLPVSLTIDRSGDDGRLAI